MIEHVSNEGADAGFIHIQELSTQKSSANAMSKLVSNLKQIGTVDTGIMKNVKYYDPINFGQGQFIVIDSNDDFMEDLKAATRKESATAVDNRIQEI